MHRLIIIALALVLGVSTGFSENKNYDSGMPLRVRLKDGNIIKARYMFEEADSYVLRTDAGAEITVPKENVVEIDDYSEQKSPRFSSLGDPNYTGLGWESNARPLRKGDAYISSIYGVIGTIAYSPLSGVKLSVNPSSLLYRNSTYGITYGASYSKNIFSKLAVSAGGDFRDGASTNDQARLLSRVTFGGNDANVTAGFAMQYSYSSYHKDIRFGHQYDFLLGGYTRLTNRKGLMGEFLYENHRYENRIYQGEDEFRSTVAMRFHWTTFSMDVGVWEYIRIDGGERNFSYPIPWLSFYYRFKG